jgi:hypothetical protein
MCRISEEIQQKAMAKMIKAAMKNCHFSFEQACEKLEIPKEDRPELEKLIAPCEQSAVPESQSNAARSSEYESVPVYRRSMVDQAADQLIDENFEAFQKLGK